MARKLHKSVWSILLRYGGYLFIYYLQELIAAVNKCEFKSHMKDFCVNLYLVIHFVLTVFLFSFTLSLGK